ncbi:hypothetical protein AAFN88_12780 [Pelagibius sp. CAU 1746]|uniref:hypothetical protein n=1 Tax=Pelagibius sp. CAU 1746 TaxID=3140370 RepID=UPI00325B76C2
MAAVLGVVPLLYIAWLLSWFGTFAGTCTGADPKSLGAGMFYSAAFYAGGILCLLCRKLNTEGFLCALPLIVLLIWQAIWSFELFTVVFLEGHSACTFMMGSYFGEARGGQEYIYVFYYVGVSVASLMAIGLSHFRYRRSQDAPVTASGRDK